MEKKQIFIKDMSEISLYIDSHLIGKRAKRIFSRSMWMVLDWIIHQRVPWEQNIRYIYLPSLNLSIIMWLSHLLTSFSSQRNRYLFPKYRVTHIWAERFRYGYTPSVVMVSVHASSAVDCIFELQSGHTKDYAIGICCFSAKYAALRGRRKDWLARNQNNVSEWIDMSTRVLLFQWANTNYKNPTQHVGLEQSGPHHHLIEN